MKLKVLQAVGNGFLSLSLSHECHTNMGVILLLVLPSVQNLHQDVSYKAHMILRVLRGKSQVALLLMYQDFPTRTLHCCAYSLYYACSSNHSVCRLSLRFG